MSSGSTSLELVRPKSEMETEILEGLSQEQKSLPSKYLYDRRGCELFEQICQLDDYYPTRTEKGLLLEHGSEIAALAGKEAVVIEPGAGTGEKAELLFRSLEAPAAYVPIEIAPQALAALDRRFKLAHPRLPVALVCHDFSRGLPFPHALRELGSRRLVFFPGSTIGNFEPRAAITFFRECARLAERNGGLLVGVDLKKDPWILLRAYDDSLGITAEFNLNILRRLNRELKASFELSHFFHEAQYNERLGRVEMHLVSRMNQIVPVAGEAFRFRAGESIHTESSYKYSVNEFTQLAAEGGWALRRVWRDRNQMFGVFYFEPA